MSNVALATAVNGRRGIRTAVSKLASRPDERYKETGATGHRPPYNPLGLSSGQDHHKMSLKHSSARKARTMASEGHHESIDERPVY
jgi:hypothetical protein